MPHDIGPELHLARPKTHHGFVAPGAVPRIREPSTRSTSASGCPTSASSSKRSPTEQVNGTPAEGDYQIELLEYEWPDLPPIVHMKDAVCRKRVSRGINYLLPVDKGKNSIDSRYRTDLRAMFQEPYATEGYNYDDSRISKSVKIHFKTNVVDTRWTRDHMRSIPVNLNSDSEKIRKLFAHSAPAGGRTRSTADPDKMKTRSSLFLPIKARDHPEAQKLRKEVDNIIKSVQEDNDEYGADKNETKSPMHDTETADRINKRKSLVGFRASDLESTHTEPSEPKQTKFTATSFDTYDQLKKTKPPKPLIPEQFKSEFLSNARNQEIWDWLHYGETITDFEYFLSICG